MWVCKNGWIYGPDTVVSIFNVFLLMQPSTVCRNVNCSVSKSWKARRNLMEICKTRESENKMVIQYQVHKSIHFYRFLNYFWALYVCTTVKHKLRNFNRSSVNGNNSNLWKADLNRIHPPNICYSFDILHIDNNF